MIFSLLLAVLALVPHPRSVEIKGGVTSIGVISNVTDRSLPAEGYRLMITADGVTILSSDAAGAFYARQTLEQLKCSGTNGAETLPCVEIVDSPQFGWRGVLLDEGRHFFGKETVKSLLDLMARHKLNVLHWHLTEDQGWRIDIPGHPELVKYGAVRRSSPKYGAHPGLDSNGEYDIELNGERYGPFYYTEEDIREILAYAKARFIKVVPEIELPGHVLTVLAAHPEFACCPANVAERSPRLVWGVAKDVLCIGNEEAIRYMEEIIDYVCRLFPSEIVHIGGDECPRERWKDCPKCQARIRQEGLKDENALQPWVTRHFLDFLAARGKRTIGWDIYLLGGNVPTNAIGMSWRTRRHPVEPWASSAEFAARGYDIVIAHNEYCYLDYRQGLVNDPFQYIGGNISLEKSYSLDPFSGVEEKDRAHILGGQGCCWSEFTWNRFDLEWKTWPRMCALAEVFWTGEHRPGFKNFETRMKEYRKFLLRQGVNCAPIE